MTVEKQDLVEAVKQYALENYERGGWDYVVETYTDADIEAAIGRARTPAGAIRKVGAAVGIRDEYRREVRSQIF